MKNAKLISAFLIVLLLFSGCSSAQEKNQTAFTANQTETTASVAASDTTTTLPPTTQASTQASEPSASSTTGTTAVITSQASNSASSSAVTSETAVSASSPESTSGQPQTTKKSIWPLLTKPSEAEEKATKKSTDTDICTVTITCTTINQNRSMLKKGKERFVPESGMILDKAEVAFASGDTAFDVIQKACRENVCTDNCQYCQKSGIQLEYNYTPAFGTYYVEGIHQLYEKDCGSMSGWMFSVNGKFPTDGSSAYTVKPGDSIVFAYTCDMGDDIGNTY